MNMRLIHKGQKGLTLIEIVIVIGLTSIVVAAITGTILGVFNTDARTRNSMTAVYQVRHAGKLVSEDILEAQPNMIDDEPTGGEFLILGWIAQNFTVYSVNYTLESMPSGEFKILWRKYYINPVSNPDPVSTTKVAEYINPDPTKTSCVWDDVKKVLTFKVTATVGEQSETREYKVQPRPGS